MYPWLRFSFKTKDEPLFPTKTGFLVAGCPSSSLRRVAGTWLAARETEPTQEATQKEQVMRDTPPDPPVALTVLELLRHLDRDPAPVRRLSGLRDGCGDLASLWSSSRFSSSTEAWAVAAAAFGPGAGVTLPRGSAPLSSVRRCPGQRAALRSRGGTPLAFAASVLAGGCEAARPGPPMIVSACLTRLLHASSSHAH